MTLTIANIAEAILGVLLVVYVIWRQMNWTAVDIARMWRMPLLFGLIGLVTLVSTGSQLTVTAVDLGLLAIEGAVAIVTGALMGFIAVFRPIGEKSLVAWRARAARRGRDAGPEPEVESRTGWVGVVLWVVLIAVRVGLGFWGHSMGSAIAESSGVILLVLAVNRIARTFVFSMRHDRHRALAAR